MLPRTHKRILQFDVNLQSKSEIHASLCHSGVTRLLHFVRTKKLLFSTDGNSSCRICAELKPSFYKREESHLIKASKPFEQISIDFNGSLQSSSRNKYLLVIFKVSVCFSMTQHVFLSCNQLSRKTF